MTTNINLSILHGYPIPINCIITGKAKDKPQYAEHENLPDDVGINLSEIRTRNLRKREAHRAKLGR